MRFQPSCYVKTSKPEIADFPTGHRGSPVVGWNMKIIWESLHGSVTSIFYFLKGRSNHSRCFTCTDVNYFVAERFCLPITVTAWDRSWGHVQVLFTLSLHLLVWIDQGVADFCPIPNLLFASEGSCLGTKAGWMCVIWPEFS